MNNNYANKNSSFTKIIDQSGISYITNIDRNYQDNSNCIENSNLETDNANKVYATKIINLVLKNKLIQIFKTVDKKSTELF